MTQRGRRVGASAPTPADRTALGRRVAELAERYLPLAREILRECIRIPADFVDRPVEEGGDPRCGLSAHEGPRLEYLRRTIVEVGAATMNLTPWWRAAMARP